VVPSAVKSGTHLYKPLRGSVPLNHLAFGGTWSIGKEAATAGAGAALKLEFAARRVFLVLGAGRSRAATSAPMCAVAT
jgi:hypothetical protein